MNIGFIGLGVMGALMALQLMNAGHQLFVNTRGRVPESVAVTSAVVFLMTRRAGLLLAKLLVNAAASRERGIGGIKLKFGQPDGAPGLDARDRRSGGAALKVWS